MFSSRTFTGDFVPKSEPYTVLPGRIFLQLRLFIETVVPVEQSLHKTLISKLVKPLLKSMVLIRNFAGLNVGERVITITHCIDPQGVGHDHVQDQNNSIFAKIFHVSLLVLVQKSNCGDRWGLVDIVVLLRVYSKLRWVSL